MRHFLMHQLICVNKLLKDYDYDHDDVNNDDDVLLLIIHQLLLNEYVHDYEKILILLHLLLIQEMKQLTFFQE